MFFKNGEILLSVYKSIVIRCTEVSGLTQALKNNKQKRREKKTTRKQEKLELSIHFGTVYLVEIENFLLKVL